ncbi:NACHT domain-containing protein [Streptomyces lushanensis]|uniref:NACHT domain-containing protein n=1 Tax=Streptomyces lushanensis TaxID=1434255 RepID=UPI001FDEEBBB|nr:NACHT domain-containing protein [Streptomyces lushanensis]
MAIGLTALAVSVWTGWLTVRSLRWQEAASAEVAERLAVEVLDAERAAGRQLLGDHDKAIDIRFTHLPAPAHNADDAGAEGRLEEVAEYYRLLQPRRLVITGAPGAGKTVLAVQLMLRLLETRMAQDPVPVRLSLASWNTEQPVDEWIARHLVDAYRLSVTAAEALVKARRVLPVLDGLDEMDADPDPGYASRAGRAVRAFNAYQQSTGKAGLVLTCRSRAHEALAAAGVWAHDAARVEIRPVDPDSVQRFLRDRVDDPARWSPVREALAQDPHGPLATGLSTPWRLTLAVTVYEERLPDGTYRRHPRTLPGLALDTSEAVGKHLLGLLIPAAAARRPAPRGAVYTTDEVRAWLAMLAAYLQQNAITGRQVGGRLLSGTDIVLHELWPLAGTRLPRAVSTALVAALSTVGSAALLLLLPPTGTSLITYFIVGVVALGSVLTTCTAWRDVWPEPVRMDLGRLRTPVGRRHFARAFVLGLASATVAGVVSAITIGSVFGLAFGLTVGLITGLVTGLASHGTPGVMDPNGVVRNDLAAWLLYSLSTFLVFGFGFSLVFGLVVGLVSLVTVAVVITLASVLMHGPRTGLSTGNRGMASIRYVALLLCTRRWGSRRLPWRLGRFLDWCYGAGLIRVAGIAYQFRHRELQEYLALHIDSDPSAGTDEPS